MLPDGDVADTRTTFDRFILAINAHDTEAVTSLMTTDHLFVDSLGNAIRGSEAMKAGWRGYFGMCPDYRIKVRTILLSGDLILSSGEAGGTINGTRWSTPAAWQALIHEGRVAEWRVFADNKPVYEILAAKTK